MSITISSKNWGTMAGKEICLLKLQNANGAYVELTNYGARIVSVVVPDKNGKLEHVVLGFNEPEAYLNDQCYLGATIGRFANRIAGAAFTLNGEGYKLEANDGPNSNHSGPAGCDTKVFDFAVQSDSILFSLELLNGEGGFPGNMKLNITYRWTADQQLQINYSAVSDADTIANFTNHAYFNLSGERENILEHRLSLDAAKVLETNAQYIPTGRITDADKWLFSNSKIADKLLEANISGFNQYYISNKPALATPAAVLDHYESGRRLSVYTTYPGLMFYTGDYLTGTYPGKASKPYRAFDGLCLECQFYPDAPNHPTFPTTVLKQGTRYNQQIIYQFSTLNNARHNL
ncbi:aldose epimerase family protein [Mucilaginibacter psychrotolerans]|uniref:Aldose 1-epimerase n=1 Tax=Mucilaginibacter psychrotolerans TaxID=1524096 RepID=A0A4Y8SLN3_9SPHI|nr:aldose epimerase family protein [Mucilaginibacter psychrotolerans]TFF39324.1 galactose mutarotase [Mucilaginibacter psychrotolerans]